MDAQKGFAPVSGGQLYFEVAGQGEAVLFIHGFSLDTHMWDAQFQVFTERYRAIRFDLRGFGQSPPANEPYSPVEDVRALLDYLGVSHPHIVGLSMGGGVALDIAVTYPDLPRSLVLVDAALGGFPYKDSYGAGAREIGLEAAKEKWLGHPLFEPAMRNPAVAAPLRQMVSHYSGWHWLHHVSTRDPDPLPYNRLYEIIAPTLVVVGELEVPDFRAIADLLAEQIQGALKVVLPGAGHMSNMEAPEAFNETVLSFLGSVRQH